MEFSLPNKKLFYFFAALFTFIGLMVFYAMFFDPSAMIPATLGLIAGAVIFTVTPIPLAIAIFAKTYLKIDAQGVHYKDVISDRLVTWNQVTGLSRHSKSHAIGYSYSLAVKQDELEPSVKPPLFSRSSFSLSIFESLMANKTWYNGEVGQALKLYAPAETMTLIETDAKNFELS